MSVLAHIAHIVLALATRICALLTLRHNVIGLLVKIVSYRNPRVLDAIEDATRPTLSQTANGMLVASAQMHKLQGTQFVENETHASRLLSWRWMKCWWQDDHDAHRNQPSVLVGVFNTIGQIEATNSLWFHENTNGLAVALDLLELRSAQTTDAAVLDDRGQHLGSIDELDVMRVLDEGGDLNRLRAKDIMRKNRLTVTSDTPIMQAAKMMEEHRILSLPVERNGQVTHSVRCHDLLRARIGLAILDRNLQFRNNL